MNWVSKVSLEGKAGRECAGSGRFGEQPAVPLETRVGGIEDAKKATTKPESVECQAVKPESLPEFVGGRRWASGSHESAEMAQMWICTYVHCFS